jgi:hypothetical protein
MRHQTRRCGTLVTTVAYDRQTRPFAAGFARWLGHIADVRKRSRIILVAAIVAALGLICWAVSPHPPAVPDPVYAGHRLSYWVRSEVRGDLVLDTNAVPYLVRGLKAAGPARKAYNRLWYHLPAWLRPRLPNPMDADLVRQTSCILLGGLGTKAKPAIPDLIRLMREDYDAGRVMAALALGKIARSEDTAAVEALVAATKDPGIGELAGSALITVDPEAAAKAGFTNAAMGTLPP